MIQKFNNQKVRCPWPGRQVSGVRCGREGFSLLEAIIVIAIISLLAALTAGSYGNFTKNIDLDSTAKIIVSDLRAAQAKAMSGNDADDSGVADNWGICFRNPSTVDINDRYQIYSAPTLSCVADGNSDAVTLKTTIYLPGGVTFSTPGDEAAISVVFSKITGAATVSSGSTIVITGGGQTKTITITPAGLISSD